jgi:hypothetical protein
MAWIAFTRKNIMFRLSILLLACTFVSGCAQGPKAFFANAWDSGRDGAANLAQKMPWKKNSEEDEAIVENEEDENGVRTVSMQDSEDKTGSVFSSWVRKGSKHEKMAADPFLNQSWVKKAQKENSGTDKKVINVSRETTESNSLVKGSKSKETLSELDLLLEGISPSGESEDDKEISFGENEFVDGVDSNLDELRASLKKDTESNNQLVIPELKNNDSKELVEKKMILAETFLVKGDIESARKKALEAQKIIEKENLVYQEDSPSEFLDRINLEKESIADNKKTSDSFDKIALNDQPLNVSKKKSTKKKSRINMAFPYDSSTDGWKSESKVSKKTRSTDFAPSSSFDSFSQKIQPKSKSDTGMIVDTDSLTERESIREDYKKRRKTKKTQIRITPENSDDSWDTSALNHEIKKAEKVVQTEQNNTLKSKTATGNVKANSHSKIKLASHEKNLLTSMGNMKVVKNPVQIKVDKNDFLYPDEEDEALSISDEEITLAPIGGGFPNDEYFEKEEAKRKISSFAYLISAGLFIFGLTFMFYRKLRKAKFI